MNEGDQACQAKELLACGVCAFFMCLPPWSIQGHMRPVLLKEKCISDSYPMDVQEQACQASCTSCMCWLPTLGALSATCQL